MQDKTQAIQTTSDGASEALAAPGSYTSKEINLLKRTVCQGATNEELSLFVQQCKRYGLDPFTGQIHAVKRWDSSEGREVMSVQVGIDGARLIAERTGKWAGVSGPYWCGPDGEFEEVWLSEEHPAAAKVGVHRTDWSHPRWAVALWSDYCPTRKNGDPTFMWRKMGAHMLAKCAESLGLRMAFPNDLGGLYTNEEMQQAGNDQPQQKRSRRQVAAETYEAEQMAHPHDVKPYSGDGSPQKQVEKGGRDQGDSRTITDGQRRRLWAIANENGYTDDGVHRLIASGSVSYQSVNDIERRHYEAICEVLEEAEKAARWNRDPAQTDAFEQEPAEADPGDAHNAGTVSPKAFRAALEEVAGSYDTPEAKAGAVNSVASDWSDRLAGLSDEEREPYSTVFSDVLQAVQAESKVDEVLNAMPALSQDDRAPRHELPDDFPSVDPLREEGIETGEHVVRLHSEGDLSDVSGLSEKRCEEAAEAAFRLVDTGDWRTEAIQQQDEELDY